MSGHFAIQAKLAATTALTALVGARIYADVMPAKVAFPAVTYQNTGGSSERGALSDPPLKMGMFQVSAWAKSRNETIAICEQIRLALDRMRKVNVGGIDVDDCFYEGEVDSYDFETLTFFTHTTFRLHYRDAA
jgi:hypothetical protein